MEKNTKQEDEGDVMVTVRLRPEQIKRLDQLGDRTYRRRSDLLRMAVDSLIQAETDGSLFPNEDDPDIARRNPVVVPDRDPGNGDGKEAA